MKKHLYTALLFLMPLLAHAQYGPPYIQPLGAPGATIDVMGAIRADSLAMVPKRDTSAWAFYPGNKERRITLWAGHYWGHNGVKWVRLDNDSTTGNTGTVRYISGAGTDGVDVTQVPITDSGFFMISLGDITPNSVAADGDVTAAGNMLTGYNLTVGGSAHITGTLAAANFSGNSSGINTGDQTNITGNAGTATAATGLKTATTIVTVSSATAPTSGQVLTATGGSNATWQSPVAPSYPVTSVFGRTGAVVATTGDYNSGQVPEGTNLYYTDARARNAISATGSVTYNPTTGVINGGGSTYTATAPLIVTGTNIGADTGRGNKQLATGADVNNGRDSAVAYAVTKQAQLNGTGNVRANGTAISYDNSMHNDSVTVGGTAVSVWSAGQHTVYGNEAATGQIAGSALVSNSGGIYAPAGTVIRVYIGGTQVFVIDPSGNVYLPTQPATGVTTDRIMVYNPGGQVVKSLAASNFIFNNPTPAASAVADIPSTTQGVLLPRMTTTQMNAIASPAEGLMIYNLTAHTLYIYEGAGLGWTSH